MVEEFFIVSFDFDGVLAHGLDLKIKYAKQLFGVNLKISQTKKSSFNELMNQLGKPYNYRHLMDRINEEHIMEYKIPEDCIPVLSSLFRQGCRLVVITSRIEHDYPYAVQFIKEKFGDLISYTHNTKDQPKGMFVGRVKPRIHIDDDLNKLLDLQDYPVELIYYRQPENTGQDLSSQLRGRILEASSFTDLYIMIRRIQQLHKAICLEKNINNVWYNVGRIYSALHSMPSVQLAALLNKHKANL